MMTPGPVEEVGQTARSIVGALGGQPMILGMLLVNIALLAFMFYALKSAAASRDMIVQQVLTNSQAVHQLLQQRAVPCPQ
jgi:hypothetical protein